jgi:DNA-binding NtrC family response regulator
VRLSEAAAQALRAHAWPGNVRELRNCLERALLLSDKPTLDVCDLQLVRVPHPPAPGKPGVNPADEGDLTLAELERRHVQRVLEREGGHVEAAAAKLGIPRSTLYQKLKQYRSAAY